MSRNRIHPFMTLAVVALVSTGLAFAGGAGCTQSTEACATHYKEKYQTKGWLGVEMDKSKTGMKTVTKVMSGSPAKKAGFQVGDQLVSINGIPYDEANYDKIKAMGKEKMKIGSQVVYGLKRGPETITAEVTLAKIPDEVLAKMIDKHQKTEHQVAKK